MVQPILQNNVADLRNVIFIRYNGCLGQLGNHYEYLTRRAYSHSKQHSQKSVRAPSSKPQLFESTIPGSITSEAISPHEWVEVTRKKSKHKQPAAAPSQPAKPSVTPYRPKTAHPASTNNGSLQSNPAQKVKNIDFFILRMSNPFDFRNAP